MDTNLTFEFGVSEIMDRVDGEVSRHAAFLRFQDGGSAYDALKIHTNDKPSVSGFISNAFRTVQTLFAGECSYGEYHGDHIIGFNLPDFDEEVFGSAKDELERYVTLSATARWLGLRSFPDFSQMVSKDAEVSLNRIVTLLRTRKFPIE